MSPSRAAVGLAVAAVLAVPAQSLAADWTPPRDIFPPAVPGLSGPQIAFAGDGSALAVWARPYINSGVIAVGDPRSRRDDLASRPDGPRVRRLAALRHPPRHRRSRQRRHDVELRHHVRAPACSPPRGRRTAAGRRRNGSPVRSGWARTDSRWTRTARRSRPGRRTTGTERGLRSPASVRRGPPGGRRSRWCRRSLPLTSRASTPRTWRSIPSGRAVVAWSQSFDGSEPGVRVMAAGRRAWSAPALVSTIGTIGRVKVGIDANGTATSHGGPTPTSTLAQAGWGSTSWPAGRRCPRSAGGGGCGSEGISTSRLTVAGSRSWSGSNTTGRTPR